MQNLLPTRVPAMSTGCASGEADGGASVSSKPIAMLLRERWSLNAAAVFSDAMRG
jgi:hypothetical protein